MKYNVMLSAELSSKTKVYNIEATRVLQSILDLKGIKYLPAQGMYKGVEEKSFTLIGVDVATGLELGRLFKQESILIINEYSKASLRYLDKGNKTVALGTFQPVMDVIGLDAYSVINKQAWAVV